MDLRDRQFLRRPEEINQQNLTREEDIMYDKLKAVLAARSGIGLEEIRENKINFLKNIMFEYQRCIYAHTEEGTYEEKLKGVEGEVCEPNEHPVWKSRINDDELQTIYFTSFLNKDYEPPASDPYKLLSHIHALWLYFNKLEPDMLEIPLNIRFQIDFVLAQVICKTTEEISKFQTKGSSMDKTLALNVKKKAEKTKHMELVLSEYEKRKKRDLSLDRKAQLIRDIIKKKHNVNISKQTIKNYIEEHRQKTTVPDPPTMQWPSQYD